MPAGPYGVIQRFSNVGVVGCPTVEFQIVRTTDPRAPFFWRMVDDAGHLLTYSSDRYATVEACREAIDAIKVDAGDATVTVLD